MDPTTTTLDGSAAGSTPSRALPAVRPGDKGLPVLGRTLDYARDPMALFRRQWDTYGPVSPVPMLGGDPWVMLLGPEATGAALLNRDQAFVNGPAWSYLVGPFFDRGLMLLDFDEHRLHRRIMQEAFSRRRLQGYAARMHAPITAGLDRWEPRAGFATYPALKALTLDVAAEIFMGGAELTSPTEMAQVNAAFVACVQGAGAVVRRDLPGTRWRRALRGRRLLEDFLRSYLPSRRERESDDMFSQLCHVETEAGERYSDDDVVNHMVFLMMAAHDTSTITLATMFELLGKHPEWQQRCRGESADLSVEPTLDELDGLTSLDLVMRECLRMRSPVPVLVRRTVKDTEVAGVRIPADRYVSVAPQFGHYLPDYWTEPDRFDPERFSSDRREDTSHRFAYEPFGGGAHKCLGQVFAGGEVKAVMHHALRRWSWHVDPAYVAPINNHSLPFPSDGGPVDLQVLAGSGPTLAA